MLGAVEPKFWRAFCIEAGRPDWIERQGEALPQEALRDEVAAFFSQLTLAECCVRFEACDCCFSPVLDLREGIESEHVQGRRLLHRSSDGDIQALFPVHVNGEPPQPRERARPAPAGASWQGEPRGTAC
jgi:crotonobetainyl-CoA:carnitine CoA-transferase CaiB-like acyl-CoA transferase